MEVGTCGAHGIESEPGAASCIHFDNGDPGTGPRRAIFVVMQLIMELKTICERSVSMLIFALLKRCRPVFRVF